jgi:hypothetical protein
LFPYGNEPLGNAMIDGQKESFDLAIKHLSTASKLVWSDNQRLGFIETLKDLIKPEYHFSLSNLQTLLKVSTQEVEFTDNFIADQYPLNATPSDLFLQVFAAIAFFEEV